MGQVGDGASWIDTGVSCSVIRIPGSAILNVEKKVTELEGKLRVQETGRRRLRGGDWRRLEEATL